MSAKLKSRNQCRVRHETKQVAAWRNIRDTESYKNVQLQYTWKYEHEKFRPEQTYATDEEKLEAVNKILQAHETKLAAYQQTPPRI